MITNANLKWAACAALLLASFSAGSLAAQKTGNRGSGSGRSGPPQAMIKACDSKVTGDTCSATGPNGKTVTGTCFARESSAPLACRPKDGARRNRQSGSQSRSQQSGS